MLGNIMKLETFKQRALANPEVKAEYDQLEGEFALIDQLLSMRTKAGLTQTQAAERIQTQKSNVSRLKRGNANPSWATLTKYAHACGYQLTIKPLKAR